MKRLKFYISSTVLLLSIGANAQQLKKVTTAIPAKKSVVTTATKKPAAVKTAQPGTAKTGVAQPAIENLNFAKLMNSTARVMFIDSMVVSTQDIIKSIPLASGCGTIEMKPNESGTDYDYTYTNELGTKRFISTKQGIGLHTLYVQEKLGNNWGDPEKVEIPSGVNDIICPYLMPDGVTFYFAASGGEDRLGKYDVYFTRYDDDNHTYYKPTSLGLPFNSYADDTFYLIDDFNNLGYLVTNRHQTEDMWCIYVFEPTETRQTYDLDSISEAQLDNIARLRSMADTQTDPEALAAAKARYEEAKNGGSVTHMKHDVNFVINSSTVYHKAEDFKSSVNRDQFPTYLEMKSDQEKQEAELAKLRAAYHNGDKSVANTILKMEYDLFGSRQRLQITEKQIRNTEIQALKQ